MTQHLSGGRGALAVAMAATLFLGACAETQLGAQVVKNVARTGDGGQSAAQNVSADPGLAPDVFDVTGLTIWDGAATLQGVWLAHPLAQRAQRVRVANLENGQSTEGAMFRRDPTLSGPSILVSSDAARALGLTPGSPTELRIVALREGPAPTQIAATETAEETAEEGASPQGVVETAALAPPPAAEAAPADPEPAPAAAPEPDAEPSAEPAPGEAQQAADEAPAPEPAEEAPAIALEETDRPEPAESPAPQPRPVQSASAPPQPAPQTSGDGDLPRPAVGDLPGGDYLQIGSFSIEYNARLLVGRLREKGQPAQYVNRQINGKPFSVVVIGPLQGAAAIDAATAASAAEGQPKPLKVTL